MEYGWYGRKTRPGGKNLAIIYTLRLIIAALMVVALSSCTTTQAEFAQNPKVVPKVNLCRTYLESRDPVFQQQIVQELQRRGVSPWDCPTMVQRQNQAAAALVAVALVGGAAAYCANRNCGGGYYNAYPGNCQYTWQYDAAGHRCGNRAASVRPGGW